MTYDLYAELGRSLPGWCNSNEEDQLGMKKCGVLHFGDSQWLACRAISASADILVVALPVSLYL